MSDEEREIAARDRQELAHLPPGVRHLARWVRLCERQGTRLVDEIAEWRMEARRANEIADRHARALERIADAMGGDDGYTEPEGDHND